jgi:methylenetetrahydrofolate reductase (NADPH)
MRLDELLRDCSLEATLPRSAELQALRSVVPAGSCIYLAAPPTQPPQRLAELARAVRAAGFEPVPHLAARRYGDTPTLDDVLARLAGEAGVTRVLAGGGDLDLCLGSGRPCS